MNPSSTTPAGLPGEALLTHQKVESLVRRQESLCVSFFLPTHRRSKEIEQDPIRLKNLLREALHKLEAKGMRSVEARRLLAPASDLLDDPHFWRYQSEGLALFLAESFFRSFRLPIKLPEQVFVDDHFHVAPLIPVLNHSARFLLLALSQNQVRLLECSPKGVSRIHLEEVPSSLSEALAWDDPQKELQFHTGSPPGSGAGKRAAVFHGSDGVKDSSKDRILRYFQKVDRGLRDTLRSQGAPLILAAVDYLIPIYKEANSYSGLAGEAVTGNPEKLSDERLLGKAWPIAQQVLRKSIDEAIASYDQQAGGSLTSAKLEEILPAARQGRVRYLFAASGLRQWGRLEQDGTRVRLHKSRQAGDQELIDLCVVEALLSSDGVFVLDPSEVPGGGSMAALFRY